MPKTDFISGSEPYFEANTGRGGNGLVFDISGITASSSLKEGETVFSTDKMSEKSGNVGLKEPPVWGQAASGFVGNLNSAVDVMVVTS